jgi:GTP cyclohydrolase II
VTYNHHISHAQTTAGQIEVERAIAEIRSGRPIILHDDTVSVIVVGIEALDAALAAELDVVAQGAARLILPASRLRRLGLERREPGFVALPTIDLARLRALALQVHSRIDAPVAGLSQVYFGALELLRLSLVLPAALAIPKDSGESLPSGLLSVRLADVQGYRAARAAWMRIVSRAPVPLEGAPDTEFVVFRGGEGLRDQVAVLVGAPNFSAPVAVRLHSACLTGDLFGSLKCDCGDQLRRTARFMAENDGGILLYIDQEGRGNGISNKIRAYELQAQGYDTFDADEILGFDHDQRKFDFAANMLRLLGVTRLRVMTNNPIKIAALESAGLEVVSDHRIFGRKTDYNIRYLAAKRDRAGHFFECDL